MGGIFSQFSSSEPADDTTSSDDAVTAALARADAVQAAQGDHGGSRIFKTLLYHKPYENSHLSIRMLQPDDWEQLHVRHKQRDPTKGCIDPTLVGTADGRDVVEMTLQLPSGPRTLRMFAYVAHLVNPDTLWDPESVEELPIYQGGTWTGSLLWDSAVHTAQMLLASSRRLTGKSVLELGSGLGLPGLVCHALGASPVLLTDRPQIAELVSDGLAHAGLTPADGVRSYSFEWDEAGAAAVLAEFGGRPPDLLLACDCIFSPLFGDAFLLLQMLDLLAGPHTTAIVALERRAGDGADRFFEKAAAAGFSISPPRVECNAVLLFKLTRAT